MNIIAIISLLLILMGLIGNTLVILVIWLNNQLKKDSTMVYIMFIGILDTISLFVWNLNNFMEPFFNIQIENMSLFSCKFSVFFQYMSLQSSALLICIMCIDRLLMLRRRLAATTIAQARAVTLSVNNTSEAWLWSFAMISLGFLINFHIIIFIMLNTESYGTSPSCYYSPIYDIYLVMNLIHLIVYTFLPLSIIAFYMLYLLLKYRKSDSYYLTMTQVSATLPSTQQPKWNHGQGDELADTQIKQHINETNNFILFIAVSFLLLTLPASILFGAMEDVLVESGFTQILDMLSVLQFLNNSSLLFKCLIGYSVFRMAFFDLLNRFTSNFNLK